jgi:hypothetical protein
MTRTTEITAFHGTSEARRWVRAGSVLKDAFYLHSAERSSVPTLGARHHIARAAGRPGACARRAGSISNGRTSRPASIAMTDAAGELYVFQFRASAALGDTSGSGGRCRPSLWPLQLVALARILRLDFDPLGLSLGDNLFLQV